MYYHLFLPESLFEKKCGFILIAISIVLFNFSFTKWILKFLCSKRSFVPNFIASRILKLQQYFLNKFVPVEEKLLQRRILCPYLRMSCVYFFWNILQIMQISTSIRAEYLKIRRLCLYFYGSSSHFQLLSFKTRQFVLERR